MIDRKPNKGFHHCYIDAFFELEIHISKETGTPIRISHLSGLEIEARI